MARLLLGTRRSSYVPARAARAWLPFWRAVVPRWRRRAGRLTQSAASGRAAPVPYPRGDTAAMRRAGARGPTEAWVKGSKRTLGGGGTEKNALRRGGSPAAVDCYTPTLIEKKLCGPRLSARRKKE